MLNNESGRVFIEINGYTYMANLTQGKANLTIALPVEEYTAKVYYFGDDKYNRTSNVSSQFKVLNKTVPYINISVDEVTVEVDGNITFSITTNSTANVTVRVNGEIVKIGNDGKYRFNATQVGSYNITAEADENAYFYAQSNSTLAYAVKHNSTIAANATNVVYGNASEIRVEVPEAQSGFVRITIKGTDINVTVEIINGIAKFNATGLDVANNYEVNVTYLGNDKYNVKSNVTYFNITKANLTADVIAQNVTVEENTKFVIVIPDDFKGNVSITVDGTELYNATAGMPLVISDKLLAGAKNATVRFYGDANYNDLGFNRSFTVYRAAPTINVTINDVTYPGNATALVNVSNKANGTVEIYFNNNKIGNATVINGVATVNLTRLSGGVHEVFVKFITDDAYNYNATATAKFEVIKANVTVTITRDDNDIIATITPQTTGQVTFIINGNNYTRPVINGNATLPDALRIGDNSVVAIFEGNENYTSSRSIETYKGNKTNSTVNVTATSVVYGNASQITVLVPIAQTGNVRIVINNTDIDVIVAINAGIARFNATGLDVGRYYVNVTYLGDDSFGICDNHTYFTVTKANLTADAVAQNVTVEEDSKFVIIVPEDFKGNVSITVDGTELYNATANVALVISDKLLAGVKNATVKFYGDANYNDLEFNRSFTVYRVNPGINVTITDVTYAENATATIEMSNNANGTIKVLLNGNEIGSGAITNGAASFDLARLAGGIYNVTVEFTTGDEYNNNVTTKAKLVVNKTKSSTSVSVNSITVGDNATVTITVSDNATGIVTVYIDGKAVNKTIENSKVEFNITGLAAGNHSITAEYLGDANFTSSSDSKVFNVAKAACGVKVDVSNINVTQDEIIGITAPSDFNGTAVVEVNGEKYYANITNGQGQVTIKDLAAKQYTAYVTLLENEKYLTSYNNTQVFTVSKYNSTLVVEFANITVGENAVLNITIPADAYGNVTIKIANKTVDAAVYGGLNTIVIPDLPVGVHDVNVTYNGNFKYLENKSTSSINVTPIVVTINDVVIEDYRNGTVLIRVIGENATGNVTVKHKGEEYSVSLTNGSAIADLTIFNNTHPGINNFTIIYSGDVNHNSVEYNTTLYLPKWNSTINITTTDIMVGGVEVITINVTSGATGLVLVDINGVGFYMNLTASEDILKIIGMPEGSYNVTVTYLGDDNYTASTNNGSFVVSEGITLVITGSGNNTLVTVTVPGGVSGNLTVLIDGNIYNVTDVTSGRAVVAVNNLTPGVYNLTAVFRDQNGTNTTADTVLVIGIYDTPISIDVNDSHVGDIVKVVVSVPVNATQDITIAIDGMEITNVTNNGEAVFYIKGLTAGTKTITATYAGNETYAFNSTYRNFTVSKVSSDVNVSVSNINVTQDEVIGITAPSDFNGTAVVEVNGEKYYANITNGQGQVTIRYLAAKQYDVYVTLVENDKYLASYNNTQKFTVSKYSSTLEVEFANITFGDNAVFNVTIPADAFGNVTVTIGTTDYVFAVKGGLNKIIIENIAIGNHTVVVKYGGNFKYMDNTTGQMKLQVSPSVPKDGFTVEDLGNRTVVVTVPNATGNVTVKIGDNIYNATLDSNGVAYIDLVNETPGIKIANVTYLGDATHSSISKNKTVVIPKGPTPMSIVVSGPIYVDGVAQITVYVPENITSGVAIEIDGVKYTAATYSVGQAVFTVSGLTAGKKTVTATFDGNENYSSNGTTEQFNVYKHASFVNVNTTDINVGETAVINITAPDYNGIAIVKVNGVNYTAVITNGFGQINITGLLNGTYNVNVTYVENGKYLVSTNDTVNFTVSKLSSDIQVNFNNITVGENAVFYVTVPGYGNLTISIAGEDTTVGVKAGNNIIIIPDLKVGTHDVSVKYSGNYKYLENVTAGLKINVNKTKSAANDFKVNDTGNGTIIITAPENVTGNITVIINGENATVNITDGTAVINILNITNATPGENNITIIYSGDENNTGLTFNTTVMIPKWNVKVNATGIDIVEGFDEIISIELIPLNATSIVPEGIVLVEIEGTGYYANVTVNGKVDLAVKGLKEGNYTAHLTYLGNKYYNEARTTTSFKVGEGIKIDVNGTGNSSWQ